MEDDTLSVAGNLRCVLPACMNCTNHLVQENELERPPILLPDWDVVERYT